MFPHFGMNFSLLCNRFLIYKMRILPWKSTGQKSRKWRMRSRSSWRRSAGWRILWRRPRRMHPTSPVMKLVSGPGALRRRIVLHVGCTGRYLSQNEIIVFLELPPVLLKYLQLIWYQQQQHIFSWYNVWYMTIYIFFKMGFHQRKKINISSVY